MKPILFGVFFLAAFAVSTPAQAATHRTTHRHVATRHAAVHHSGAATSHSSAAVAPAQAKVPKAPVSGDGMQSDFDRVGNSEQ